MAHDPTDFTGRDQFKKHFDDVYENGGIPLNAYKQFKFIDSRGNTYYWPKDQRINFFGS